MTSINNDNIRSIIIIQNKFRMIKQQLFVLNNELLVTKSLIYNMLDNVNKTFNNKIIGTKKYNINLDLISEIHDEFKEFPSTPIKLSSLANISLLELQVKKSKLTNKILEAVKIVGLSNLDDILKLFVGSRWTDNVSHDFYNLVVFFNKYINIIKVDIIKNESKIKEILEIAENENFQTPKELPFCTRSYPTVTKSFYEKIEGIRLFIPYKDYYIKVIAVFKQDTLSLAKNELPFADKYSKILAQLKSLDIPDSFKYDFLAQLSLRDFVSNCVTEIINKVRNNYNDLNRLKSKTLSETVKEFVKSTVEKQRKIIILLLISEEAEDNFLAHIIYDMILNDSYLLKSQPTSELIYNSLAWNIKKKIKLTEKNFEKEKKRLKNLTESDIPIEKRIALMKADDIVKTKAYDKLAESGGSKESSAKATKYLEGLLKIPFGSYKKEYILSFLDTFKSKLKSLINEIFENIKELDESPLKKLLTELKERDIVDTLETETDVSKFMKELKLNIEKLDINLVTTTIEDTNIDETFEINKDLIKDCIEKIKTIQNIRDVLKKNDTYNIYNLSRIEGELKTIEQQLGLSKDDINSNYNHKSVDIIYSNIDKLITEWNDFKEKKKKYLIQVRDTLDKCVHGHDECKMHIERIVGQWINGKMEGTVFGMQGPPGVGKTTIAKNGIAKCLIDINGESRPFCFLPLGGSSNGSTLEGHNYTYVGSTWGKIVDMIIESKCMNPIIYIDEVDKVSKSERGQEIISILTHLTDLTQNGSFSDRYFSGIPIDLSKVVFIFSYNDRSKIDRILLDRITEIKVKAINNTDKLKVAKCYLMPEILDQVGFKDGDIVINKKELLYVIENYTFEAGVRKLKEKLYEIVREINLNRITDDEEMDFPYTVSQEKIDEIFSNNSKIILKKCAKEPHIGMVNGLYATSLGTGGLTIIQVYKTISDNKLSLELTGSQGDVMKESMKVAKTLAWNIIPDNIKKSIKATWDDFGPFGLHIHCPEGATPKDGPSAGTAITCAIISRLCGIKISNLIALTGEITLRGNVTAIGGVDSKVSGAKRAGAKKVLLPEDNRQDYEKYVKKEKEALLSSSEFTEIEADEILNSIEVIFVSHLKEVVKHIFVDNTLEFQFENI